MEWNLIHTKTMRDHFQLVVGVVNWSWGWGNLCSRKWSVFQRFFLFNSIESCYKLLSPMVMSLSLNSWMKGLMIMQILNGTELRGLVGHLIIKTRLKLCRAETSAYKLNTFHAELSQMSVRWCILPSLWIARNYLCSSNSNISCLVSTSCSKAQRNIKQRFKLN